MVFAIEKACVLVAALLSLELSVCHPMAWFEGELVFYLVYFVSFCFSFAFPSCSPKSTLLHLLY
jgi:hypothetical protein